MANGNKILVIGRHPGMMERVLELLRSHGYEAIGAITNEEAFQRFTPDTQAVVIGGGVDRESRRLFHSAFPKINPAVKVVDGHPHTVLEDLERALDK